MNGCNSQVLGCRDEPTNMVQKVRRTWKAGEGRGPKGSLWGNWSECHCGMMSLWGDGTCLPWARLLLEWTILDWSLCQEQIANARPRSQLPVVTRSLGSCREESTLQDRCWPNFPTSKRAGHLKARVCLCGWGWAHFTWMLSRNQGEEVVSRVAEGGPWSTQSDSKGVDL